MLICLPIFTYASVHHRFNSNDRDVLSCLSFEDVETFYKASHKLTSLIRDPTNELVVTPRPGRAALFDNWRYVYLRRLRFIGAILFRSQEVDKLRVNCRGCDWLFVMLKSITKIWPLSNYQAFMLLDHTLFRE